MSYEVEGILHVKYDTESKTDTFQARDFILKTEGTYPQFLKFQLTQDRCGIIDSYNEGEKIKVFFDLRGREWNGKYFTNLHAWKLEKDSPADTGAVIDEESGLSQNIDLIEDSTDDLDDLPF